MNGPFYLLGSEAMQTLQHAAACPHHGGELPPILQVAQTLHMVGHHPALAPKAVIGPLDADRVATLCELWNQCTRLGVLPAGGGRS